MAARWRSILVTPNVLGKDGVSALSREMARALPQPALILSLHDKSIDAARSPVELDVRGADGSRLAFLVSAIGASQDGGADLTIACSHLHLAPIARLIRILAGASARPILMLCGIEAWVPLRAHENWAVKGCDIAAISQHTAYRFRYANSRFRTAPISICHPGVAAVSAAAPRFGESPIALIVARMSAAERYKGHDALLDIWPKVLERHPEAVLAVVGDGDDRARLEAKARDLGIHGSVTFAGRVGDSALAGLYARCRFFVMPSRDEGFGLVFLEAMRAAKPCNGGDGAAAEIIENGTTGIILDPANQHDLLAAILRLFDDSELCKRLGDAGRVRFLAEFTDRHFQARFARLFAHDTPAPATKPTSAMASGL
jgi:phosphatidylinositol alpha-1,6-mannosyltransferase